MERADQIVLSSPFVTFSGERHVFKTSVRGVNVVNNYEKYFGTPERAAKSINDFRGEKPMKNGARTAFQDWVRANLDRLDSNTPLVLMWLQGESE